GHRTRRPGRRGPGARQSGGAAAAAPDGQADPLRESTDLRPRTVAATARGTHRPARPSRLPPVRCRRAGLPRPSPRRRRDPSRAVDAHAQLHRPARVPAGGDRGNPGVHDGAEHDAGTADAEGPSKAMKTVNIQEGKAHLSRLIEAAPNAQPFTIAHARHPLVKVEPLEAPEPAVPHRLGFLESEFEIPDDFDTMGDKEILEQFRLDQ